MDRIYESDVSQTPTPTPFPGSEGYTQRSVPWASVDPTVPGPYFYFYVTESMRAVIVAAGLVPDLHDRTQFYRAVVILAGGS